MIDHSHRTVSSIASGYTISETGNVFRNYFNSVDHTACPHCGEPKPLARFWTETMVGRIMVIPSIFVIYGLLKINGGGNLANGDPAYFLGMAVFIYLLWRYFPARAWHGWILAGAYFGFCIPPLISFISVVSSFEPARMFEVLFGFLGEMIDWPLSNRLGQVGSIISYLLLFLLVASTGLSLFSRLRANLTGAGRA